MTEVECFDPLTNEWTLSKALPESRSMNDDDDDDDDDEDDGGDVMIIILLKLFAWTSWHS